ncbi:MAG: class I adenylate cyclase [Marinobacter sp.]|uniref:class I adenylate cyclase n=1 Tax=Marinobacter sp. TaxID=50741 RepID=UPI00299EE295|nr:class I adenylate cyclase [Marinobacter sp.]MDX1633198.1 class I adenylate cyclase [Marinobacter sp.]
MTAPDLPIRLDFDEGIDRKVLRRLRDRFWQVNEARWQRAHSALTYRQQVVLEVLPLVFHLNHPALPGYLDHDCPFGIAHYQPSPAAIGAAQRLARSFALRDAGKRQPDVEAMFLMGSPGSLGHSVASDLDVWLCHRPGLTEAAVERLERKAARVSEWAAGLGLELHVFVFCAEDWRHRRHRAEVSGENCGSAQHYLLLDEFYRTGIHLAGCFPLWWLVPVADEGNYEERARQLIECRFIKASDYIDFGAVPAIPEEEFLGAGVWQLYKGIDSPWKSLLKLLLIECYARDPAGGLLSLAFKAAIYGGETDPDRLDPYALLYQRLERWLVELDADSRLDLVRRALYFKAGLPLSRAEVAGERWRGQLLQQLVTAWGWGPETLRDLDNRQLWRAEQVITLRRAMVNELSHSYRLLSRLARTHALKAAISQTDMGLLGRKLYAAFQRKAGKIELINPNIAPSLAEENLAFHHQSTQGLEASGEGWLLYRDLENPADAFWQPVIRRASNLTELLVWSYCNGLLTRATRLNVRAGSSVLSVAELRELLETLSQHLPVPLAPASRDALLAPARPLTTLLLVNVALDPQARLTERGLHKLSGRHDSLGFSGGRENLVHTIDQVTLSSWHEVSLQHYAAGDTLIQCLKNYLASVAESPRHLPVLAVHSFGGHGGAIARRVQELFADVQRYFFAGGTGPHALRYVIEMDRRYFVLQFQGNEPGFVGLDSREALMDYLRKSQQTYSPVLFDRYALLEDPALRAVCQASQPESVQVFYQQQGERARIWVVDELGSVCGWQQVFSSRRHLLAPLFKFLENLLERRQLRQSQGLTGALTDCLCYELVMRDGQWHTERRPVSGEELPLGGLEVQAVGVQEGESHLRFDIYCGDQEFTLLEYGDQLIPAVAHYIRSRRRAGESYPVYLTDIHLPHDLDPQVYQQDLQTTQYLYYRRELEQALNQALAGDMP